MSKSLEKSMTFRLDEHLLKTITLFAKEHGYKFASDLVRDILTTHFMNIYLGYTQPLSYKDMQREFMEKFAELKTKEKKKQIK